MLDIRGHSFRVCVMWRNYLGYIPAVLAVLNALIATLIARLPDRRSVYKLRLGVTTLVIGAIAVGGAIFAQHSARFLTDRQVADRIELRKRVETFALEGRGLLDSIRDPQRELPARAADEWAQRTEIYLRTRLGDKYVTRFRSDLGPLYGDDTSVSPARIGYWRAVRNRVLTLDMISAEFSEPAPIQR
jgi:hypothetical protein